MNDVRTMGDLRTTWLVDIPPGIGVDFMSWLMWTSKKDMNALSVSPNVVMVSIMFWPLVYISMFPNDACCKSMYVLVCELAMSVHV